MIHVLFVCLGNICRSPMAEAVLRHQVKEAGLEQQIQIDSAGTGDWHIGHPPHEGTRKLLDSKRISWNGMTARQVKPEDFAQFDYVIAMDNSNLSNLKEMLAQHTREGSGASEQPDGGVKSKMFRLLDLLPERKLENVPDPYYTGNFDEVYEMVEAGCRVLLKQIQDELKP
ncbi:low molecular weight phosphotyrosine protein phosphatase [Paenibacillus sp. GYB004]|uniref:low molecular weight protein-tyrosine-phosphatase n=1 Tax=Paenibacillus sp. GYB004 TaxID=2994393 RepID=UPI002F96BEAF